MTTRPDHQACTPGPGTAGTATVSAAGAGTRAGRREWGSVSLEIAILGPVLLLVVFSIVQGALWFHARSLALAAAQQGLRAASAYQAGPNLAQARARQFLTAHGADTLHDTRVEVTATATRVRVQVSGRALSVLPGLPGLPVSQVADGPREHLTSPS